MPAQTYIRFFHEVSTGKATAHVISVETRAKRFPSRIAQQLVTRVWWPNVRALGL